MSVHAQEQPHKSRYDAIMAGTIVVLGTALTVLGQLSVGGESPTGSTMTQINVGLGRLALTIGAIVLIWWFFSFLAAVLFAVAARCGFSRLAHQLGLFSPAFFRRLALALLGISLVGGPTAQAAVTVASPPGSSSSSSAPHTPDHAQGSTLSSATIPTATQPGPSPRTHAAASSTLASESAVAGRSGPDSLDPRWRAIEPHPDPTPVTSPAQRQAAQQRLEVAVLPGDSLWSIVARYLGPQATDLAVATEWPRWYQHNQRVIGHNPDFILPGTLLQAPPPAAQ